MNSTIKIFLVFLFTICSVSAFAVGGTVVASANGNFSAAATWTNVNINRTGTVSKLANSATVTGSGTAFQTELTVGSVITTQGGTAIGTVLSIQSQTSLTLTTSPVTAITNQTYRTTDGPPAPEDAMTVNNNIAVTVDRSATVASVSIAAGNQASSLTISATFTLTVTGSITYAAGTGTNDNKSVIVNGALNAGSIVMVTTGAADRDIILSIANGASATITGDVIMPGAFDRNHIDLTGTAQISIGGDIGTTGVPVAGGGGFTAPPSTSTITLNGTSAQTVYLAGNGGSSTFGNVTIDNSNGVTSNQAFTTVGTLTLESGTLAMGANLLTIQGNLVNNGGNTSGSGGVTISGSATQSIGSFTTTGTITMSKTTSSTATLTGVMSSGPLVINGTGCTLNLGNSLTHSVTTVTLTAGTLNGGTSSTLNVTATSATAWTGTGTNFTAGTGTVNFSGAAQTLVTASTFNNLTFSGSGTKTLTGVPTVNGILSIELTSALATISAAPTYNSGATLQYNTATSRTAGLEWPALFTGTGGVIIDNTATITANGAKQIGNGTLTPLTINLGATLDMSTNDLSGTLTPGGLGILKTSSTSTTALTTGKTWTMEVQFVATGNQNVPIGTYTKLTTDGTGVKYIQGDVSVATLTLTAAAIRTTNSSNSPFILSISSSIVRGVSGGQISAGTGTVNFTNSASDLSIPQGTFSSAGAVIVSGGKKVLLASDYGNSLSLSSLTTTGTGSYFGANGNDLTLTGTVNMASNTGLTGSHLGGTLKIGSGAAQVTLGTLRFDQTTPGTTNSVYNVTINTTGGGSVSLGNIMRVRNTFQPPTSGTFVFNADSNLVIASRSTHTGRIATINTGFSFGGKVVIERFVKEKTARRYVFLASPVDGISIRNGWQDDIYITSPANGGTPCSTTIPANKYNDSGYDATTRKLVTIYKYNQAARQWDSVISPTTSTYLQKGIGYRVYYRGARKADSTTC